MTLNKSPIDECIQAILSKLETHNKDTSKGCHQVAHYWTMVFMAVAFSISMGLLISFGLLLSTIYTQARELVGMNFRASVFRASIKAVLIFLQDLVCSPISAAEEALWGTHSFINKTVPVYSNRRCSILILAVIISTKMKVSTEVIRAPATSLICLERHWWVLDTINIRIAPRDPCDTTA